MKKLFMSLSLLMIGILILDAVLFSASILFRYSTIAIFRWGIVGISFIVLVLGLLRKIKLKEKVRIETYFRYVAILLVGFSLSISHVTSVWSILTFTLAVGLFLASSVIQKKLEGLTFVIALCIFVPILGLILFGGILGFTSWVVEILILLEVALFSIFVGKKMQDLINVKNACVSLEFAGSIVLYLANFVNLIIAFSYVSHYIRVVFIGLTVVAIILFVLADMLKHNDSNEDVREVQSLKNSISKNKWGIVSCALVMVFVGYSLFSILSGLNIATAKISKEKFLGMMGENFSLPIIEITTENGVFPDSKENYINASFSISNCENDEHEFSVNMAENYGDDGSVGIRLRGNSTMDAKKKPFRIKFDDKQSLLGLTKAKSWVLLADYFDQSYARNYTAFSIAKNFDNLDFTPTPHHVALILNGSFQGLYLLCEQVDENKGRTNVEEDFDPTVDNEFPFLVEMDNLAYKEGETGVDNFYVEGFYPVEIKYPEADERGATETEDKVYDYIYEYINAVFETLKTGETTEVSFRTSPVSFEDLVDVDSVVDYYLLTEIMHNPDSTYKSIYFHKTKDGKMEFGPIWDYDYSMAVSFDLPYKESYIGTANYVFMAKYSAIFSRLLASEEFFNKVKSRYNVLSHTLMDVASHLKTYKSVITNIARLDASIWHGKTGVFEFDMQYDYVRLYLQDRCAFLNSLFTVTHSEFMALCG